MPETARVTQSAHEQVQGRQLVTVADKNVFRKPVRFAHLSQTRVLTNLKGALGERGRRVRCNLGMVLPSRRISSTKLKQVDLSTQGAKGWRFVSLLHRLLCTAQTNASTTRSQLKILRRKTHHSFTKGPWRNLVFLNSCEIEVSTESLPKDQVSSLILNPSLVCYKCQPSIPCRCRTAVSLTGMLGDELPWNAPFPHLYHCPQSRR